MTGKYLPLRYRLDDQGEPQSLLPYDTLPGGNGELERVPVKFGPEVGGFAVWLEHVVTVQGSGVAAAQLMRVDEAELRRWIAGGYYDTYADKSRWYPMSNVALARVDQVLMIADTGENIWTLYPYLDSELTVETAFCHACAENVMPIEGVCPWCETKILDLALSELPEATYRRRRAARKRRARLRTVRPPPQTFSPLPAPTATLTYSEPRLRIGTGRRSRLGEAQIRIAAQAYVKSGVLKEACDAVLAEYGLFGYADARALYQGIQSAWRARGWKTQTAVQEALENSELMPPRKVNRRGLLDEKLLHEAAWRYYYDEWGFERIGRLLHPLTRYRSAETLARALHREFQTLGWPRRDRVQAARMASFKHGLAPRHREASGPGTSANYKRWLKCERRTFQPRCKGTVLNGKRKGKRCLLPSLKGERYCVVHMAEGGNRKVALAHRKRVDQMRERSHASELPAEPLAGWLEHVRLTYPSQRALCRVVAEHDGSNWEAVESLCRAILSRRRVNIRRETVERFLNALGDGLTVEGLYGPFLASQQEEN